MTSWSAWDVMELAGNHLWQSTICLALAFLLTLALKRNRAQARYWVWLAASLKFLVPFAPLMALGREISWRSQARVVQPTMTALVDGMSQPFSRSAIDVGAASPVLASPSLDVTLPLLLLGIWLAGCTVTLLVWWAGWLRLTRVVRDASPLQEGRELDTLRRLETLAGVKTPTTLLCSNTSLEPGVFGLMTPVLLWPRGIAERLTQDQLEALIAHEVCHLRRRDNLAAATHMVVEALFWFHPLVWWLERRLVEERERACDEAVIAWGHAPMVYAESILRTCEFYAQSRLAYVAGVTGADLKKRIEAIMGGQHGTSLGVSKKRILATIGVAALAAPILAGALSAPRLQAQSPPPSAIRPAFDVASIKPNKSGAQGGASRFQPGGRYVGVNVTLRRVINLAYSPLMDFQIVGGPGWIASDHFDVDAKAEGNPSADQLRLMLRALLAERFKLSAHTETRELPVFALVMARTDARLGPQLSQSEVDCSTTRGSAPPPPAGGPARPGDVPPCGSTVLDGGIRSKGITMERLAGELAGEVGRVVVDRTGLAGGFDVNLDWTPETGSAPQPGSPPSIFTALQEQLGLKLEPIAAPVTVLVIDGAEKPTDNQTEPSSALEVRLAETAPGPGLVRATVQNSDRQIYLHDTTVMTGNDVLQARVVGEAGQFSVAITLSPQGAEKMSASTAAHSGRPLAIIVNGVVVAAPTVRGRIGDQVLITGDFTREQADRIAEALQR